MASSRFQDVRAALAAAVTTQLTSQSVTDVKVFQYPPSGNVVREDMIWFGTITVDQEPLTMGGTGRGVAEDLQVDFFVRAPRNGASQDEAADAENRAEVLLSVIENAVRGNPTLSTVMFAEVDSFEVTPTVDELGFVGSIEGTISCQANL